MAIIKDIEVRVRSASSGAYLEEYDNPKGEPQDDELRCEKYIEAETDAGFSIDIILKAGFDYFGTDGVVVQLKIDDGAIVSQGSFWDRESVGQSLKHDSKHTWEACRKLLKDGPVSFKFAFGSVSMGKLFLFDPW